MCPEKKEKKYKKKNLLVDQKEYMVNKISRRFSIDKFSNNSFMKKF